MSSTTAFSAKFKEILEKLPADTQGAVQEEFSKILAKEATTRTRRAKKSDDQKEADIFLGVLSSMITTHFSKAETALPKSIRTHFLNHIRDTILEQPHPDGVDEETLAETIADALDVADSKRQRYSEQAKLTTLKKDAAKTVLTHTRLSETYQESFMNVLGTLPRIPNSHPPTEEAKAEADEKWESALEEAKVAAEKELVNRKKTAEKAKARKAAKKAAESEANSNAASEAGSEEEGEEVDGEVDGNDNAQYADEPNASGKRERAD